MFLACMNFDTSVRTMLWEFGYWGGTIKRWYGEGLPKKYGLAKEVQFGGAIFGEGVDQSTIDDIPHDKDVHNFFGFDDGEVTVPINIWMYPAFKEEILEEDGNTRIIIDNNGIKKRMRIDDASIPQYIDWPVKDKKSWENLKAERFQVNLKDRLPTNWEELKKEYKKRDYPLSLGGNGPCGFFGSLRNLFGVTNLLYAYYDYPELIKDILSFLTDFWISLFAEVLSEVDVDYAKLWEDMAFKNGPLISPKLAREFMLPCYKKLTSFLRDQGVSIILLDSDGDCRALFPIWMEGGITGIYPNEVQAGMDIIQIRKTYPHLQLLGGLDKRSIASSKGEIDLELNSKVPFMLKHGGYIPFADHLIPPDVSWENFKYYREKLHQLIVVK